MIENVNNVNSAFSYKIFTTPDNLAYFVSIDDVHSYLVVHIQASKRTSLVELSRQNYNCFLMITHIFFKQIFSSIIKNFMKNIMVVEASPIQLLYGCQIDSNSHGEGINLKQIMFKYLKYTGEVHNNNSL